MWATRWCGFWIFIPRCIWRRRPPRPVAGDVLCLADAMVMSLLKSSLSISGYSDVYRKALRQELTGAELAARAAEHKIPLEMNRCVIVFQLDDTDKASAYSTLGELLPLGETDVLVEMNRREAALIKDMEGIGRRGGVGTVRAGRAGDPDGRSRPEYGGGRGRKQE